MINYYFIWLHTIAVSAALLVACLLSWLTVAQATKRRLGLYLKWLIPFAVGNTVAAVATLLTAVVTLMRILRPAYYGVVNFVYVLSVINAFIILFGIIELWKMLKKLPQIQDSAAEDDGSHRVWPPPPRSQ